MKTVDNVTQLIGSTPLLRANAIEREFGLKAKLYFKLECMNPTGSVKDRAALGMIEAAVDSGELKEKTVIIEPTSGNTGIALASVCAVRGIKLIITMPETMSVERRKLMAAYGAELVLTPGSEGMGGAIRRANELREEIGDAIIAGQFYNPANPQKHYVTTGPEIFSALDGNVDFFVAGVGSGGTLTGTAMYLKHNGTVRVAAVEPADSAVLSGGKAGAHKIQGIGAGFVPDNLDRSLVDEVIKVTNDNATEFARLIAKKEGVLVGISSGAAAWAAVQVCKRAEAEGKTVVTILPDDGDRYLSVL